MVDYISKMDAGALGTWVGSIGTVLSFIVLGFLAYKQNSINKRQFLLSRSQLYIDSSIQLLELIDNIAKKIDEYSIKTDGKTILGTLSEQINKIYFCSQLYLSSEITEFIEPVRATVLLMLYDYDNYLYMQSIIKELMSNPDKRIRIRREVMMIDYNAYYSNDSNESLIYSQNTIENLNKYCYERINLMLSRKKTLLSNPLESKYSAHNISKKYKKWIVS